VTLHILCDREHQIAAFVPQDYWNVFVEYAEGFRAFYHGSEMPEAESSPDAMNALRPNLLAFSVKLKPIA
jgi:DNA topoisomerase IA